MNARVMIPSAVMIAVASVQIVLTQSANLTPWKGGGFGMFSTLDHAAFRGVDIVVEAPGRSEALEIPPSLQVLAIRAVSFPSEALLVRLGHAIAARERRHSRPVTNVKLTVWRTDFSSATLQATERTLRTITVDAR